MRIIAGLYGGRTLRSPADHKIRPTSDRLRETLFNILAPRIDHTTRFLDLCSGTGAIGIEAVSRGVGQVTFVDRSRRACALIEDNLDLLNIPEHQTSIVCLTAETFSGRDHAEGWDIIYYDPPYDHDYSTVMFELGQPSVTLLNEGGVFIAEHHIKNQLPDALGLLRRWRLLKQGETNLSFYERN